MTLQNYIDQNEAVTTKVLVIDKDGASALLPISFEQLQQMRSIWRERWSQSGFRLAQCNKDGSEVKRVANRWKDHEYSQTTHANYQREWKLKKKANAQGR